MGFENETFTKTAMGDLFRQERYLTIKHAKGVYTMNILKTSKLFLKRNSATILTCTGAIGVVATTIMAIKATPKATILLEEAKKEKGKNLTVIETVKTAGPVYIPTIITGVATITCIFGANVLNKRQQASLISAYALLDKQYKDYRAKVNVLYGNGTNEHVKNELVKDKYEEEVYPLEDNKVLFYDEFSERYFESTMEKVTRAEYILNRDLSYHNYAALNEFYDLLKLEIVDYGDILGWNTFELMDRNCFSWIDFRHRKVELEDGLECYIIEIITEPIPNFEEY